MSNHKSALGRSVDMSALISKNENVRAVGNMKVNARGDTIDSYNRIIKPSTDKVSEKYNKTIKNTSMAQNYKNHEPIQESIEVTEPIDPNDKELLDVFEQDDIDIEKLKKQNKD